MNELDFIAERLNSVADPKALLEGLFAHAPVALQVYRVDGHCLLVNDAFRRLFGAEPPPEYNVLADEIAMREGLLDLIHRAFAGETIHLPASWYDPRELQQVSVKEGRRVAIEVTLFPLLDAQRVIRHVALCFKEVTSELMLKEASESLQRNNERLARTFDAGRMIAWETDLETGSLTVSDSARAVVGLLPGQTLDTLQDGLALLHPEDRPLVEQALTRAARDGKATDLRFRVIRPDTKRIMWLEWRSVTGDPGGGNGVRGVVMDMTEAINAEEALRISEERYRTQFEAAPEAIVTLDVDRGCFVEANKHAEQLFGYPREQLFRMHPLDVSPTTQADGRPSSSVAKEQIELALQGKEPVFEWLHKNRDGQLIPCEIRLVRLPGVGNLCRGSVIDIGPRKKLEQALFHTEEQLRQSQKMEAIGRLAGGVAHDFNNLLSVILSYSSMLLSDLKSIDPIRGDIEAIKRAGEKAADLTRQLLAFSRQQVLAPKVLNLNDIIEESEKMLRRLLGEDIELITRHAPELWLTKLDPGQVDQIIMNLAVNARDAMQRGGKLTLETKNVELDEAYATEHLGIVPGRYVMLAVSDNGSGMDKETRARIFEPFFTTKDQGKGTGLGLSTVFGIVQQSGGTIWVYSEPGAGTTFKLYFPHAAEATGSASEALEPETLKGSETILLVEDQDEVRLVAREILRRCGYHVLEARNAGEALLNCERHPSLIHLMVTDVVMPQMSGRELAERLSLERPNMRVLYMSGYTENAIVHHAILDSGIAYLQKPIVPELLARRVREVLDAPPRRTHPPPSGRAHTWK